MKKLLCLALALIVSVLALAPAQAGGPGAAAKAAVAPASEGPVTWYTLEQAQELCKKKPKKIFIDVYTSWCGWCKVMDKKTFAVPAIAKYLNDNYYPVKLDAEQEQNIIFNGKVYGFNAGRRTHEVALAVTGNQLSGYPTVVFLDEKLNLLQPISSYLEAKPFDAIIHYYGDNAYKKTPWQEYEKGFKSAL